MNRFVGACLLASLLAVPDSGIAQAAWEGHKEDCDAVFASWQGATSGRLKRCVSLWEAYRDVGKVDAAQRRQVVPAFERLCRESDPEAAYLARQALLRLGVVPPAVEATTTARPDARAAREPPRVVSDADRKAAEQYRAQGMARYKKRDWDGALTLFRQALDRDPGHVQALYDAACTAALAGHAGESVGYLDRLASDGSKPALAKVRKAWRDKDFDGIRDDPEFKRATGWARIRVLHGLDGDLQTLGDDNAFKLAELLGSERLGFLAVQDGTDRYVRDRPHVWYQPHAKASAYVVREVIGHPRTRVVPIDWRTDWDIVVTWADRPEPDGSGGRTVQHSMLRKDATGRSPEDRLDGAIRSKDEALATPDEYLTKTENLLAEPGQTADQIDQTLDRATGTVDKAGKSVDKVKGLFK